MTGPGLGGRLRATIGEKAKGRLERLVGDAGPDARAGRPFAEFAGVLDGRHLWLAVADAGADAALGLRLPDGTVEPLAAEHEPAAPSAPPVLAARVDLVDLVGSADWAGRLPAEDHLAAVPVLLAPGRDPEPIWTPPGSLAGRERRQQSLPPGLQPRLRRTDDGTLALLLRLTGLSVRAVGFAQAADGIEVRVEVAEPATAARVLREGDDGAALSDLVVTPVEHGAVVRVPPHVALPAELACPVVVDTAGGTHRVCRPEDDVGDAGPATRMPGVVSADGASQVRFGWDRAGHLVLLRDVLDDDGEDADDSGADEGPAERRTGRA